jgi:hypothetical protein
MKSNELSNIEINKVLSNVKLFNGVYMRDELNYNNIKKGFYVLNLDESKGPGTHWTGLYIDKFNKKYYFDSYGFPAPLEIEKLIKPYIYNNKIIQSINSTSCGFFVIAWILYLNNFPNNDTIENITSFNYFFGSIDNNNDNDSKKNEITLYKLLKSYNIVV